ncbi:hypothetical protein NMYAN_10248 [Nitrosomonas nitrosa]|uniref:Uncharacterized protein n=1 Tax=Nitrosomonas nitrosa TaxID=52442 RepID=A0A8H8YW61_9PROT|nr:hypothetical protein NMYAN_10248 [Nitrosomonas nitrosa]
MNKSFLTVDQKLYFFDFNINFNKKRLLTLSSIELLGLYGSGMGKETDIDLQTTLI